MAHPQSKAVKLLVPDQHGMLIREHHQRVPGFSQPRLLAVVDTEEEFDWRQPFSREATSVTHLDRIERLQAVFDRFSAPPAYVVDYPVAAKPSAWRPLKKFAESGRASIGAHLHPWVTPPFSEELSGFNSYGGNLSEEIEFAKIAAVTHQITKSFGRQPTFYKAGRYGIGVNTHRILAELGYQMDFSPAPPFDSSEDGGPDYSRAGYVPYVDPASGVLVVPGTGAFQGWLPGDGPAIRRWAVTSWRQRLRLNSLLFRSRAVERLWLSPESMSVRDMVRLTRRLLQTGSKLFVLSLHSPVILPGATPFTESEADVERLLGRLHEYLRFFMSEIGGKPCTPLEVLEHWQPSGVAVHRKVAGA